MRSKDPELCWRPEHEATFATISEMQSATPAKADFNSACKSCSCNEPAHTWSLRLSRILSQDDVQASH